MSPAPPSEKEAFLELIADSLPALVAYADRDLRYRFVNATYESWFQVPKSELIGRNLVSVIGPDAYQVAKPYLERAFRGDRSHFEITLQRGDGQSRLIDGQYVPDVDRDGTVRGIVILGVDITERKKMENSLKISETRFRLLFEQSPFSIQLLSPDSRTIGVNQAWKDLWKLPDEFVENYILKEYRLLEDPQLEERGIMPLIKKGFEGQATPLPPILYDTGYDPVQVEEGRRRWVAAQIYPVKDPQGKIQEVVLVHNDVTDQTEARKSFEFLDQVSTLLNTSLDYPKTLQSLADLAVSRLADWCVIDILEESGEITPMAIAHRDREKVDFARELRLRNPVSFDAPHGVAQVIRTGEAEFVPEISEKVLSRRISDPVLLEKVVGMGLRSGLILPLSSQGKTFGTLTLISTDPKQRYRKDDLALANEVARRASHAIENAKLYSELKAREASLQEALRTRDEFLSIASHELKTPLTALKLHAQIGKRNLERSPDAPVDRGEATRLVNLTISQVQRLTRLVEDMLDISRIAHGRLRLEPAEMDLGALAREVVERFSDQLQAGGCECRLTVQRTVQGYWDRYRIDQVLDNLINNAIKYCPGRPIDVAVGSEEGWAVLEVKDFGPGIALESLDRIFERFERATSSRGITGLGLGLYICRQIVESHGGTIRAMSTLGEGSRFIVRLPQAHRPPGR